PERALRKRDKRRKKAVLVERFNDLENAHKPHEPDYVEHGSTEQLGIDDICLRLAQQREVGDESRGLCTIFIELSTEALCQASLLAVYDGRICKEKRG